MHFTQCFWPIFWRSGRFQWDLRPIFRAESRRQPYKGSIEQKLPFLTDFWEKTGVFGQSTPYMAVYGFPLSSNLVDLTEIYYYVEELANFVE